MSGRSNTAPNLQTGDNTVHFTLYTVHFTHFTPYTVHFTHFTPYTVHCTLYAVHCALYTVHSTLYTLHTVHCTLYTVHCTLYTLHSGKPSATNPPKNTLLVNCNTIVKKTFKRAYNNGIWKTLDICIFFINTFYASALVRG